MSFSTAGMKRTRSSPATLPNLDEGHETGDSSVRLLDKRNTTIHHPSGSVVDGQQGVAGSVKLPSMVDGLARHQSASSIPAVQEVYRNLEPLPRCDSPQLANEYLRRSGLDFGGSRPSTSQSRPPSAVVLSRPRATLNWGDERRCTFTRNRLNAARVAQKGSLGEFGPVGPFRNCLWWLASSTAKPDPAYEHVIEENAFRGFGPGPVENWPLLHDDLYVCRLSDMVLAEHLRDAYEVGFRGRKRECSTASMLSRAKEKDKLQPVSYGVPSKIVSITCDACGEDLAGVDSCGFYPGSFYFCKRCKRNGNRYELCTKCHAVELSQGIGKHLHSDPHPHYLKCQHRSVVPKRLLAGSEKDVPDVRRVFCDYCGQLAAHTDTDDDVWMCPKCPEVHGVRFELCGQCCQDLERRCEHFGMWDRAALGM